MFAFLRMGSVYGSNCLRMDTLHYEHGVGRSRDLSTCQVLALYSFSRPSIDEIIKIFKAGVCILEDRLRELV